MRIVVTGKQLGMLASYQSDLGEQDSGTETGTGDTGGKGTSAGSKQWESGVTRGPDNQIARLLNGLKLLDQK